MRYLRTEKLRSFHLRPFIVLTITKRTRYKAESEAACRVSVLKQVSPRLGLGLGWGAWLGWVEAWDISK